MDAVDLNWCLACGCRIELDVCTPYCSQNCLNSDGPSTSAFPSAFPSQQTLPSLLDRDRDSYYYSQEEEDLHDDDLPIHNSWIGRGDAGIRAWAQSVPRGAPSDGDDPVSPSTLKPKLLLRATPVKPSLCMSRAQPSPPVPSRPIRTPQQSFPSLSRDSTSVPSASLASLTTGSSSYSVVTPATHSEIGSLRDAAQQQQPNFFGGLKAQFRAWAASSTPQKEGARSRTLTRNPVVHISDGSDTDSGAGYVAQRVRRPHSPAPFFHMPEEYTYAREKRAGATKESGVPHAHEQQHPAYRTRGRRTSRIPS